MATLTHSSLLLPQETSDNIRNQCKKIKRQNRDISTIAPEQRKMHRDAEEKKLGGHYTMHEKERRPS
jgi:hypothetical protein